MSDNRCVFVAGTGKSGISAAKMILKMGGEVLLYNSNEETDIRAVLQNFDPADPVKFIKGRLYPAQLRHVNLAVMSPGIPLVAPFVSVLDQMKIPVIGEL